jgi:hypothetical protein
MKKEVSLFKKTKQSLPEKHQIKLQRHKLWDIYCLVFYLSNQQNNPSNKLQAVIRTKYFSKLSLR